MLEVGTRVYAWANDDFYYSSTTKEPIMGTIDEVSHDSCWVKSTIDNERYFVAKYKLYEVGSGPVTEIGTQTIDVDHLFEDDPNNDGYVIFKFPHYIVASMDLREGDDLEFSSNEDGSILIRKKEIEYE